MEFEDLQKVWQSQSAAPKVTIDADVLLKEIRRNQRQFLAIIRNRDVREVAVCGLMTIGFLYWGISWQWWSLDLLAACCFGVGAFFVVDRLAQRKRRPVKNDSLQSCIESSLFQVKHQIWLLENVFWWYLLPLLVGLIAVAGSVVWAKREEGTGEMVVTAAIYVFVYGFTFGVVYWANQYAVRKQFEPRRQELESLLANLR
jgi:hypothetical protein